MKSVKSYGAADADDEEMESGNDETGQRDDELHRNASKQAKDCLRKSMGLIKDIYKRFSQYQSFIREFSETVFQEIVQDQLKDLKLNFTSEKSQLIEILCQNWPDHLNTLNNFEKYPDVIPALMDMLQHRAISPEVVSLIMGLLKKFIIGTMDSSEEGTKGKDAAARRRMLNEEDLKEIEDESIDQVSDSDQDQAMGDEEILAQMKKKRNEMSTSILRQKIETISKNIHLYWTQHANELKRIIASRGNSKSGRHGLQAKGQGKNVAT